MKNSWIWKALIAVGVIIAGFFIWKSYSSSKFFRDNNETE